MQFIYADTHSMSEQKKSQKQILKSSSIIGGASIINILIGLFKIKVVALLLGPAGIGLIGLLQNVMSMASNVASMGVGTVGTRQIAEANADDDQQVIAMARRALFWGTMALALLGGFLVWAFREPLATNLLNDGSKSGWVGWLAIGVMLTVASGSQGALLNGMRRIVDLAKLRIYSALFATILGIIAVWFWKIEGLLFFVISVPFATFILGHFYVSKLPKIIMDPTPLLELRQQWKTLLQLGFAFMVAGLAVTLGQLAVRTLVQNRLGSVDLGLFQAAWVISMTYIGFVLVAMGTDYYPRLTAVISDHTATIRLVNEQTEIALLLSTPVLLAMLTLAPWVLVLLYSNEFSQAAQILRWQILGDILKIISWPLGFVILASGAGKTFMLVESLAVAMFFSATWIFIDDFGVEATGIGFVFMYTLYLAIVYFLAKYKIGFRWNKTVFRDAVLLISAACFIVFSSNYDSLIGLSLGIFLTTCFSVVSFFRIINMSRNIAVVNKFTKIINKLGYKRDAT